MYGISRVGAFWGGHRIHEDAPLIVVTVEVLLSVVRQRLFNLRTEKGHLLGFVDLVVLDKFQTLGDEAIGPMWEELLLLVGHQVCPSFSLQCCWYGFHLDSCSLI
jgi:superfamily II RNA helicase